MEYAYARVCFLCGYILNDKIIYQDGLDILNFAFGQINNNGLILTEMNQGNMSLIYNCVAANYLCDSLYIMINTSTLKTNNFAAGIKLFTNAIVNAARLKSGMLKDKGEYPFILEKNIYETYTKVQQINPINVRGMPGLLNFVNYNFVYGTLSATPKKYVDTNQTRLNNLLMLRMSGVGMFGTKQLVLGSPLFEEISAY
jgi:hypothetical protein